MVVAVRPTPESPGVKLERVSCPFCGAWWYSREPSPDATLHEIYCSRNVCKRLIRYHFDEASRLVVVSHQQRT